MRVRTGQLSRQGARETNQDSFGVYGEECVYAIADGMGGLEHGERMSQAAIEAVRKIAPRLAERAKAVQAGGDPAARSALFSVFEDLFARAATDLYDLAERAGLRMGTTLTVAVLAGDRLVIGHVGDSRVYRVRGAQVKVLTEDHSVAASQVRRGQLSAEEYNKSPQRAVLYQSLGTSAEVEPDIVEASLQPGDVLVLCTDGIWAYLDPDEFTLLATGPDPREAARNLADTALARGSDDNCTAIVVRIEEPGAHVDVPLPRALAACPLFRDFKEQDLRLLGPYVGLRDLVEGDTVFREGDPGDDLYIVEAGLVELSRQGFVLAQLAAGTAFGELAMAANAPYTVSARAVTTTRLVSLNRSYLDALIARRPELAARLLRALLDTIANRLVDFNDRLGRAERALWTTK